jgi:cystathionine beta-synthase
LIDGFTKVTDKDAAVYTQNFGRRYFVGNSAGAALRTLQLKSIGGCFIPRFWKPLCGKCLMMTGCANVVFLKRNVKSRRCYKDHIDKPLIIARTEELVSHAIERMRKYKISQIPVDDISGFVGSWMNLIYFKAYVR